MSSLLVVVKSHLFLRSPSPQCSSEPGERQGGGRHYQCALAEERGEVADGWRAWHSGEKRGAGNYSQA